MIFACCCLLFRRHASLWLKSAILGVGALQITDLAFKVNFYL